MGNANSNVQQFSIDVLSPLAYYFSKNRLKSIWDQKQKILRQSSLLESTVSEEMHVHNRYIPFFIIAAISMAMSVFVSVSILKFGSRTVSTKLVLYLFITLLLEEIASIPYAYEYSHGFCSFVGFVHMYSSMSNVVVVFLMILIYRYIFVEDTKGVTNIIVARLELLVFGPSLIALFPLITNSYGVVDTVWCDIQTDNYASSVWATLFFFCWICLFIFLSTLAFLRTVWRVHKSDPEMAHKLVCSIGQYGITSVITWIPRIIARKHIIDKEYGNMIVFLSGICLFVIFLRQKAALKLFELFTMENAFDLDKGNSDVRPSSHMFTWEEDDEDTAILRKSRQSRPTEASVNTRISSASVSTISMNSISMSKRGSVGAVSVIDRSTANPMV